MLLDSVNIRKLEVSDVPNLCDILETRDELDRKGAEIRSELMGWLAHHNPATDNGEVTYYLAEDNSKIIAFHGRMPVRLSDHGKVTKAYYIHDLYVDPGYRKKGLGFWLTIAFAKKIEEESDSVICLFGMTPLNLHMQRRRRYYETSVSGFAKFLTLQVQLEKYIKVKFLVNMIVPLDRIVMNLLDRLLLPSVKSESEVIIVEKFDHRFKDFLQTCMQKTGFTTERDIEYLNWKYIDRPYKRETIYGVQFKGEIKGYIVVGLSPYKKRLETGRIVEILADPEDTETLKILYHCAVVHFKKAKVHQITCLLSDPRYMKVIKKFLFMKKPGKTMMLGNLDKMAIKTDKIKNMSNWHITYGESDAFMLSD